jgi:hypothetical protein
LQDLTNRALKLTHGQPKLTHGQPKLTIDLSIITPEITPEITPKEREEAHAQEKILSAGC